MLRVLIVDDSIIKIERIKKIILAATFDVEIIEASNASDATNILSENKFINLLILDINLPIRKDYESQKNGGTILLKEITRRSTIFKPESIIGLTEYEEIKSEIQNQFDKEGWSIIHFDIKSNEWENIVQNKLLYLYERQSTTVEQKKMKILFIAPSPENESRLNPGKEQRKIEEAIGLSTLKTHFELFFKPGAKLTTIVREIIQIHPSIIHFSGHGNLDGLAFEDDNGNLNLIPSSSLLQLFKQFKEHIQLIILSACYSSSQAKTLSELGLYVVGMNDSVGVEDATLFVEGFYQALGEGLDFEKSFEIGKVHYLSICDASDQNIPELWKDGVLINEI